MTHPDRVVLVLPFCGGCQYWCGRFRLRYRRRGYGCADRLDWQICRRLLGQCRRERIFVVLELLDRRQAVERIHRWFGRLRLGGRSGGYVSDRFNCRYRFGAGLGWWRCFVRQRARIRSGWLRVRDRRCAFDFAQVHFRDAFFGDVFFPDQRHAEAVIVFCRGRCRGGFGRCLDWRGGGFDRRRQAGGRCTRISLVWCFGSRCYCQRRGRRAQFDQMCAPVEDVIAAPTTDESAP